MNVSRAAFLRACGAALVGGLVPGRALSADSLSTPARTASVATGAARFRPHVGSPFVVDGSGHRLRLAAIEESAASPNVEKFALNFAAPEGASIPHGIYTLRHAALGSIEMFITPVGAPGPAAIYQACFSRFV